MIKAKATQSSRQAMKLPLDVQQPKKAVTSRSMYTVRCKELKNVMELSSALNEEYKNLMSKLPSDVVTPEFPESYKEFHDYFEQFLKAMENQINDSKINEESEYSQKKNSMAIMMQAGEISELLSNLLNVSRDFANTGISGLVKTVNSSFMILFSTIQLINDSIKKERIVNKEVVGHGLQLYQIIVKGYKMFKSIYDGDFKDNLKQFNIMELKMILSNANSICMHILTRKVPAAINSNVVLAEHRSNFSTHCGYIGSIMEACIMFYDTMKLIRSHIINLTRALNSVLNETGVPCTVDLTVNDQPKPEQIPVDIQMHPKPHVVFC